jgi:hypothetical protein
MVAPYILFMEYITHANTRQTFFAKFLKENDSSSSESVEKKDMSSREKEIPFSPEDNGWVLIRMKLSYTE